ncbi:response regulator [Terasakiella sp. A23]|uniref:response regulator n=1 Tax=Terasakiella sp. FCG-A23 TaxID=3080561 RepID=UPI002952F7A6|nr:response regulator [Terasakiella sp. A23]MDV7340088.1 response regulator [Terasakiella sp. A23]
MTKYNFDQINILIADQNIQLRSSLKGILHHGGFRRIQDVSNVEQMEDSIKAQCPDLLLCDISLEGGNVCKTIRKLRHNQCGQNPFCSVILFIDEPTQEVVTAASEAGLDDLQIKPIVGQKILDRVIYLVEKRKPFVVTTDYIGPDRRKGHRPGSQEIPSMPVPNSIAGKAKGTFVASEFQQEVNSTVWEMNAQKIERHAFQISYLVDRIVPAYRQGQINRESLGQVAKLVQVSKDISKRLEESDYTHIADLVATLTKVAHSLWSSGTEPKKKDLNLVAELSTAISATFKAQNASSNLANEISSTVGKKYNS